MLSRSHDWPLIPDLIVDETIIVAAKVVEHFTDTHVAQMIKL